MVKWLQVGRPYLLLPLLAVAAAADAASIRVHTDRDPVAVNESFQIIFEAEGDVDDDPDLAPLNRDFKVLSTSQGSNISIINGDMSRQKSWKVNVLARRTGRLTIPAIAFGGDRSPAIEIEVGAAAAAPAPGQAMAGSEVFLEVEAQPLEPYVQGQVRYVVRLFRATPTANASLSDPVAEQGTAVIERLGEDRAYETRIGGRSYQVVERRFSIYPQASGKLRIGPLTFQGQTGGAPFSLFSPFNDDSRTIVRQSAPVELDVRPIPPAFSGSQWLPARQLTLEDSWSSEPPQFRVGEPLTRTVAMVADGLTASQLPELPGWVPDGFKAYPDQPALTDRKTDTGVSGRREERAALIPSMAGDVTLPEIRIPWWNTTTNAMEFAVLPARTVTVLPASVAGADPGQLLSPLSPPVLPAPPPANMGETAAPSVPAPSQPATGWPWLSLVLAVGWVVTLLAWGWSRRKDVIGPAADRRETGTRSLHEIKLACRRNDAVAARDGLLRWARGRWPEDPPRTLNGVGARLGAGVGAELQRLDAALYGREPDRWQGDDLWRELAPVLKHRPVTTPVQGTDLEPLHRL